MNDVTSDVWGRQDFPPWSIRTLLVWMVGLLVLSSSVALLLSYSVTFFDIKYSIGLNEEERFLIGTTSTYAVYMGLVFVFILFQLNRMSFTLNDVWTPSEAQLKHIGIGLLLGVLLMSLQIVAHKAITGQIAPPPLYPIKIDWRLALGIELLTKAFLVGIVEEIFYRGLIYKALRIRFSMINAVLLSAVIFSLSHLDLILNPIGMVYTLTFGIIAAVLFERTRSLNISICFHIAGNATESLVYYLTFIIPSQ